MNIKQIFKSWYFICFSIASFAFVLSLSFGTSFKLSLLITFLSFLLGLSLNPDWIYLRLTWVPLGLMGVLNKLTLRLVGQIDFINIDLKSSELTTGQYAILAGLTAFFALLQFIKDNVLVQKEQLNGSEKSIAELHENYVNKKNKNDLKETVFETTQFNKNDTKNVHEIAGKLYLSGDQKIANSLLNTFYKNTNDNKNG